MALVPHGTPDVPSVQKSANDLSPLVNIQVLSETAKQLVMNVKPEDKFCNDGRITDISQLLPGLEGIEVQVAIDALWLIAITSLNFTEDGKIDGKELHQ